MNVEIVYPDKVDFATRLTVRISDINYGAHLSNDKVLTLTHEARVQMLRKQGLSELDIGGAGMIMVDAAVQYLSQAYLGDEVEVSLALENFTRYTFDIYYKLVECNRKEEIARVKTGMMCYSYEVKKARSVPEEFRKHFTSDN